MPTKYNKKGNKADKRYYSGSLRTNAQRAGDVKRKGKKRK